MADDASTRGDRAWLHRAIASPSKRAELLKVIAAAGVISPTPGLPTYRRRRTRALGVAVERPGPVHAENQDPAVAIAVQVVWSSRRGSRQIKPLGSAHDTAERETLEAAAQQRIVGWAAATWLGPDCPQRLKTVKVPCCI